MKNDVPLLTAAREAYSASCIKSMVEGPTPAPSERSVPA
jgi:hypothetical protein